MPLQATLQQHFNRIFGVKQKLVFSGLAVADFVQRHPRQLTAAVAASLLFGAGGAFAVASIGLEDPSATVRLVSDSVAAPDLAQQVSALADFDFTLFRSEPTRANDTPEGLLQRLGLADPDAAAFLRKDTLARQALFGRGTAGRTVTAEVSGQFTLERLRTQWVEADDDQNFKRLVVEKGAEGFSARVETAPLQARQRLVGGVIRGALYAATDAAGLPDSVTKQVTEIFQSRIDFSRGLRRGDRFAVVYEALEADGEVLRPGKVLSVEFVNRGKTHQAIWFQEEGVSKGAYFTPNGESLRRAYTMAPLEVSRITSGFGMRTHPVFGYSREHTGVDYAAPTGTPVRTIGDGVVTFAGTQNGYGKVIYIQHSNKKDSTVYAHLSHIKVAQGDKVSQGDHIGDVGSTGVSTGPHLHFEFRVDNVPQDPTEMLAEQRELAPISPAAKAAFASLTAGMKMQLAAASQIAVTSASQVPAATQQR